jgi:hypothetical protein
MRFILVLVLINGCSRPATYPQEHEYGRPDRDPPELKDYERGDLEWMKNQNRKG